MTTLSPGERDLREAATNARFVDDETLSYLGEESKPSAHRLRFPARPDHPAIVTHMAQTLYEAMYVRGELFRHAPVADRLVWLDHAARMASLVERHWSWSPGWTLQERKSDGRSMVARGDDVLDLEPERLRETPEGLMVRIPAAVGGVQAGWFHVRGAVEHPPETTPTTRVYWNVSRHGAGLLLRALTRELDGAEIPFHFKVLDEPTRFHRADSAVAYLRRDDWPRAWPAVARAYRQASKYAKDATPAFTKRLAPGLAVADSPPGTDTSFGMSRCGILAEGLWAAYKAGRADAEGRIEAAAARFRAAGIRVEAPWLEPGHDDVYPEALQEVAA